MPNRLEQHTDAKNAPLFSHGGAMHGEQYEYELGHRSGNIILNSYYNGDFESSKPATKYDLMQAILENHNTPATYELSCIVNNNVLTNEELISVGVTQSHIDDARETYPRTVIAEQSTTKGFSR